MKHILKDIRNEPKALSRYRNETPNPSYGGYIDKDAVLDKEKPLKLALLKEQGYLCAYCMGRIGLELNELNKPKVEVEHFESQELKPELSVVYNNLLGVCNGLAVTYPDKEKLHHCDKTIGGKMNGQIQLKKLDPRSIDCEKLIKYDLLGKIKSVNDDHSVEHDLNNVLNLNNDVLLIARRAALDNAKKKMIAEKPDKKWNRIFLQKHLEEWRTIKDEQFKSYCMIVVWFLQELMKKPQYN